MGNKKYLNQDSVEVQYLSSKDKRLAKVIQLVGPIEYQTHDDSFPFLVHEIVEQMLSVKAGAKIYARLEDLCEGIVEPKRIQKLSNSELRDVGMSSAKADYILRLADAVASGTLSFDELKDLTDEQVIKYLSSFRGIGSWTAKMYLIFILDRPNILPYEDGAFMQSFKWMHKIENCPPSTVINKCAKWKPYSSVAARYLYRALDMGLTKEEFHLFK